MVDPEIIVFNLKRRYTGVSATVNALVPIQAAEWRLAYCGPTQPHGIRPITLRQAISVSRRPPHGRRFRIWHLRRDHEMLIGILVRDLLRLPVRLVFTSAAQRRHGWFPRWLISRMDAVIATTPKAASYVPNTRSVVPHGVDSDRFPPPVDKATAWLDAGLGGDFGIGVFGRVRQEKGTDVYVEALLIALPQLPKIRAVIAGLTQSKDRDFLQNLKNKIASAGLTDRILFLGEIPAAEVHLWYQRCLLCVACPRYEAFGLTPFEAASAGCALVCSRAGAFQELVEPGVSGELVEIGDVQGLADAILKIMSDPMSAVEMGKAARQKVVTDFTLRREAQGIGQVYQQLFDAAV